MNKIISLILFILHFINILLIEYSLEYFIEDTAK